MSEKENPNELIQCINTRSGQEVEMPRWVTKDSGLMIRLELQVKPKAQALTKKTVIAKINEAKTVEEIDIIIEGEDRPDCLKAAEDRKKELNK